MSFYEELIKKGAKPEEIRDLVLEENSDVFADLSSRGAEANEIFSVLEEESGMPIDLSLKGTLKEQEAEINQTFKYLTDEKDEVTMQKHTSNGVIASTDSAYRTNIRKVLLDSNQVKSYDEVNTFGLDMPKRDLIDVLTGGSGSPQDIQNKAIENYLNSLTDDKALEEASDMILDLIPQTAGVKALTRMPKESGRMLTRADFTSGLKQVNFSKEVEVLAKDLRRAGWTDEKIYSKIKDVPKEHQARVLTEEGGDILSGYRAQAYGFSRESIIDAKNELKLRTQALEETIGSKDFAAIKDMTKAEFQATRDLVKKTALHPDAKFDVTGIKETVSHLQDIADNEFAKTRIASMLKRMEHKDVSLDDMLDIRQRANFELDRVTGKEYDQWNNVKNEIDAFIKENTSPEVNDLIEKTNKSYARMKTQETLVELIDKHKYSRATDTAGETSAVDWSSLGKELDNLNLNSPEAINAKDLISTFRKKYGSTDVELFGGTKGKGAATETQTLAGSVQGILSARLARGILKKISDFMFEDRKVVQEIVKSLEKSSDPLDFYSKVIKNKNTPDNIKNEAIVSLREAYESTVKSKSKTSADNKALATIKRDRLLEVDEIIDAEAPMKQIGKDSVVDVELMPKQIQGSVKQLLENKGGAKQLEHKDIQTSVKNANVEIEDFRKKKLKALESIVETKSNKVRHILFRNIPEELKSSEESRGFVMMALDNGNQLARDKVGKSVVNTKGGLTREGYYIRRTLMDTDAIQTHLSKASVNRIKMGKGTKEDLEKLKLDVDELRRLDELYNEKEADDLF